MIFDGGRLCQNAVRHLWRTIGDFPASRSNEIPSISGRRWNKLEAVAECLFDNLGRGIPYKRLLGVIGRKSDNPTSRHLLRQYVSELREMLLASNSPYRIAVIQEVGYCLCELAKNARHTVSVRRD
jgi:DNA-binding response OmpR family regulator